MQLAGPFAFGTHPLAVEDALHHSQRPKLDRCPSHLFLTAYATRLDVGTGELTTSELAASIATIALARLLLGLIFKRKDWL
jgi:magnesium transporter